MGDRRRVGEPRIEPPELERLNFTLGSMNKMFTAVRSCSSGNRGSWPSMNTIAVDLPHYPNHKVAGSVTIHQPPHAHVGNGRCVHGGVHQGIPHAYRSNRDYLPLFADAPLLFDPGAGWSYSNAGYAVLGLPSSGSPVEPDYPYYV